jgi:hypothetical protein
VRCCAFFKANNDLSGEVPAEFSNLNLNIVYLNGNGFTGSLDPAFCANPSVYEVLSADCQGDNPEVACSCCTQCCNSEGLECAEVSNPHALAPDVVNARLTKLRELLEPISGQQVLDDSSTDQHKAIMWMAQSDPMPQNLDSMIPELVIQRYVMILFFFATNGGGWKNNNGWLGETSVCGWDGVYCNDRELVTTFDLSNNNLRGRLISEIGELGSNLAHLLIHSNDLLSGSIPSELGMLSRLERIVMHDNTLSGFLPTTIGGLPILVELDLSHNNLSGPIPSEIGLLPEAEYISLGHNKLEGQIPSEIGTTSTLLVLELNDNLISGTIPTEISQLSLATLDLRRNRLRGGIPSHIGQMSHLEELFVSKFEIEIVDDVFVSWIVSQMFRYYCFAPLLR